MQHILRKCNILREAVFLFSPARVVAWQHVLAPSLYLSLWLCPNSVLSTLAETLTYSFITYRLDCCDAL